MKITAISLCFLMLLMGCGTSTEQIGQTVMISMQDKFETDDQFKDYNLTVKKVHVFKNGENAYKGLVTVEMDDSQHDVSVDIHTDGENVMWEAQPGAFMFIAQKQLQNIFR